MLPEKLHKKIKNRVLNNELRTLNNTHCTVDFSSNDYLGFAKSKTIFEQTHHFLITSNIEVNGATGSRLLSGNYSLYNTFESYLANLCKTESALIFNSGYTANLGFFSSIAQRGDIILYDEFIHASIRDGIQLSNAKAYKFSHNNCDNLQMQLQKFKTEANEVYVVTESVFSMDGDSPNLRKMCEIITKYNAYFIVDEAHALGVFDLGLVHQLKLQKHVFAQIITFGKSLGCHGAAILGSNLLKQYLVNFCRPFIYTTGLAPHAVATAYIFFQYLVKNSEIQTTQLTKNIVFFKEQAQKKKLTFIESNSAIQCIVTGGNKNTKNIAKLLFSKGFDVKPILSPTVSKGKERLRFCIHSYNTKEEIKNVLEELFIYSL